MARTPRRLQQRKRINDLLVPYSDAFQSAFMRAVDDLREGANYTQILAALEAGDVEAAVQAVGIDIAVFTDTDMALRATYVAGGQQSAAAMQGVQGNVRFDGRAEAAEAWIAQYSSDLIQGIVQDQVEMVRNHITEGLRAGQNPRSIALDIVGRLNRATGRREGGVLGLTDMQADWLRRARQELEDGTKGSLNKYLKRTATDGRYDRTVEKALREGKPLTQEQIDRIIRGYESKLLKSRGETIARTEVMRALHKGQDDQIRQMVAKGIVRADQVRRIWRTAQDKDVRHSHDAMEGQTVGLDEPFISGNGNALMFPGDPNAPLDDIINCRCDMEVRIDFLSNISGVRT